jgi:hypothetical protein
MGHLIDPPERVEGNFVAVFMQTDLADALAIEFLREHGIDARPFPLMGDVAFQGFGGLAGGTSIYGGEVLVCVPQAKAGEALDLLEFDSGLIDFDDDDEEPEP